MESQIQDLLSDDKLRQTYLTNHTIPENMNTGIISDISSGKLYKELIEEHDFSHSDLSLTWNTDGIPIFDLPNSPSGLSRALSMNFLRICEKRMSSLTDSGLAMENLQ